MSKKKKKLNVKRVILTLALIIGIIALIGHFTSNKIQDAKLDIPNQEEEIVVPEDSTATIVA